MKPIGLQWMQDGRIPFNDQQLRIDGDTIDTAVATVGRLAWSILFVGMGSNDYLMPNYDTRWQQCEAQHCTSPNINQATHKRL
jgi:hypothetical protein